MEETLNSLLEADQLCQENRYELTGTHKDTRAGHYARELEAKDGEVKLKALELHTLTFEAEIIERYRRRESSVEEALIEMYLAGISARRVKDITHALLGTRVSPSTVSNANKKVYDRIDKWLNAPITGEYAYVFLDGIWLKRSWGGEVKNVSVLIAIGVDEHGYRQVLGVKEGAKENKISWMTFLRHLKSRGLCGVQLIISNKCSGIVESSADIFPKVKWQQCVIHFYRNVFAAVPKAKVKDVTAMLKAIHSQKNQEAAKEKIIAVTRKLKKMRLKTAAAVVDEGAKETLSYFDFPSQHWQSLRTNNPLERLKREIRRRTKVVGAFPGGKSALMLVAAKLRHVAGTKWGTKRYMNMKRLQDQVKTLTESASVLAGHGSLRLVNLSSPD